MSDAEITAHSSLVGGSTAERRLRCPGSWQMEQKLPVSTKDQSSDYADEGSALHACMAYILEQGMFDDADLEDKILGQTFGEEGKTGYVITKELMDDCIWPCVDFFVALANEMEEEGDFAYFVEQRVQMPGIPGAFGTADVIARSRVRSVGVDWKFGVGVLVKASYEERAGIDSDGGAADQVISRPNSQLMYYNRAGMFSLPLMYEQRPDWPVDLYIVQPRARDSDGEPSHYRTTVGQLEFFRLELVKAIAEAKGDSPRIERGDHCKFASCRAICPKFTGPALDLTKMHQALTDRRKGVLGGIDIDWAETFSILLPFADVAEEWIAELRTQAHAFLDEGNSIPDWKLVPKRASESYTDAKAAQAMAMAKGLALKDTMTEPEVKSPAQLGIALEPKMEGSTKKARTAAARAEIAKFTKNVSSGTTLAHASDGRPAISVTPALIAQLSEKFAALGR